MTDVNLLTILIRPDSTVGIAGSNSELILARVTIKALKDGVSLGVRLRGELHRMAGP